MRIVLTEMRKTFRVRACEWLLASLLMVWGLVLLWGSGEETFAIGPVFAGMEGFAREESWGLVLYLIGSARIVALTINGSFWPCAHARTGLALLGALAWLQLSLALLSTSLPSPQAYSCLVCVLFDLWNARRAAEDAAIADRERAGVRG